MPPFIIRWVAGSRPAPGHRLEPSFPDPGFLLHRNSQESSIVPVQRFIFQALPRANLSIFRSKQKWPSHHASIRGSSAIFELKIRCFPPPSHEGLGFSGWIRGSLLISLEALFTMSSENNSLRTHAKTGTNGTLPRRDRSNRGRLLESRMFVFRHPGSACQPTQNGPQTRAVLFFLHDDYSMYLPVMRPSSCSCWVNRPGRPPRPCRWR